MGEMVQKNEQACDDVRQRCSAMRHLGTGPISDAMEQLGMPRQVVTGMTFVSNDPTMAFVGPAYTVRQANKSRAEPHDRDLTRQRQASSQLAQPGDVIVIDVAGRAEYGSWGENQALMAQSRGIVGLVVHGSVRDREWIRQTGFPVLCRSFSPVSSKWELETVAMNEPIAIDGVAIVPGDIIYADADGFIVIPQDQVDTVFDRALEIHRMEEDKRNALYGHGRP
ncbi:RraA family protein [Microvirga brassicacearum]|uniref:Putative 4-hydroxy-4-methyl-2-oxoglutarate aldolase n=1 Tax=Microvirga brassicacearum TaxID=2580413 RepID=A0A5N3PAP1_9HYPH|nr:RraA family protein [Microvirga brassicacearum]KAB0266800.1 RraA family protein [Microvirga brassicacearum]